MAAVNTDVALLADYQQKVSNILDKWTVFRWGTDNLAWLVHYPEELVDPYVQLETARRKLKPQQAEEYRKAFIGELRIGSATAFMLSVHVFGKEPIKLSPIIALKNKSKILERSLSIVRNNIEILDEWVNQSKYVEYIRPKGGTTAFLKYDRDIRSEELCKDILEKTGVMLVPGSALDMEGYLRVGYANNTEVLKEGLSRLQKYFDENWK